MDAPIVSRRLFLGLFAAAAAARIAVPAFTPPRAPYVKVGEAVDYIGLNLHPHPNFVGSALVREVGPWDGIGYPVTLSDQGYGGPASMRHRFYDADLSNFLREFPRDFWHHEANSQRYPNWMAFIRERRFGEPVSVMRERLRIALTDRSERPDWPATYVRAA